VCVCSARAHLPLPPSITGAGTAGHFRVHLAADCRDNGVLQHVTVIPQLPHASRVQVVQAHSGMSLHTSKLSAVLRWVRCVAGTHSSGCIHQIEPCAVGAVCGVRGVWRGHTPQLESGTCPAMNAHMSMSDANVDSDHVCHVTLMRHTRSLLIRIYGQR
jgi:hypothetical protein